MVNEKTKLEKVQKKAREIKEAAVKKVHETDEYVKEHPKKSAGILFVVGIGIGWLASWFIKRKQK